MDMMRSWFGDHCVDVDLNEPLLENVLQASGQVAVKLSEAGLSMGLAQPGYLDPQAEFTTPLTVIMPTRDESTWQPRFSSARNVEIMTQLLTNVGVDVRTNTAAKELVVEGGEVVGALVEGPDSVYEIRAKKVVLASGGFSQNREMIEQYAPRDATAVTTGNGGSYGDGIRMATEIGATVVGDRMTGEVTGGMRFGLYGDYYVNRVWLHGMRINMEGHMWEDSHPGTGYTDPTWEYCDLTEQPEGKAYVIFGSNNTYLDMFANCNDSEGNTVVADTLEELAEIIGVPVDALLASVEEYNQIPQEVLIAGLANYYMAPAEGEDVDFTVKEGPFYAFKIVATTALCCAGLKIDEDCRVLDGATGEPIPNLYAAGEVANGNIYQYYIGGWGIGSGFAMGYIAGNNARNDIVG